MSVVLAVKMADRIWLAADSQASMGGTKMTLLSPNLCKIWQPEDHKKVLFGCCGSLRDQNILSVRENWYDTLMDDAKKDIDFKYVVRHLVPEIMNELASQGRIVTEDRGIRMDSQLIFSHNNNCFRIDPDGCVSDLTYEGEAMVIGSGGEIALAAYNVLEDICEIDIKEKMIRAVAEACINDLYVNFPIYLMSTIGDRFLYDGENLMDLNNIEVEEDEKEKIEETV